MYDLKNRLVRSTKRANALVYQILPSKGPGAFALFVKCLQEEKEHMGHQTLAKLFTLPEQAPEASPVQCEDKESIGKLFVLLYSYYLCMFQLPNSTGLCNINGNKLIPNISKIQLLPNVSYSYTLLLEDMS